MRRAQTASRALACDIAPPAQCRRLPGLSVAVPRPCPLEIPRSYCCSVDDRGCLAQSVALGDIHHVGVTIPDELDRSKGAIPATIHAANAQPMVGNVDFLAYDVGFANREDTPEEPTHRFRHAKQRRERDPHRTVADVCSR